MDVRPGDILMMKKEHPCKNIKKILREGSAVPDAET